MSRIRELVLASERFGLSTIAPSFHAEPGVDNLPTSRSE
jgi:hypothetical protein